MEKYDKFFLDKCPRSKTSMLVFEQVLRDCLCHVFFRAMTTDFCVNEYSKNKLICDFAGEPTYARQDTLI